MGDAKSGSKQDFISTREAAVRLGVALSTIQSWVETGILPAWKTAGGHREDSRRCRRRSFDASEGCSVFRAVARSI
jgi:excisionase family DNA binding protein